MTAALHIYTDGSCGWKSNRAHMHGGWAFVLLNDHDGNSSNVYSSGFSEAPQTNQTMELLAVLHALRYVREMKLRERTIVVHSDSTYVINGMESQFRHQLADGVIDAPNKEIWLRLHKHAELCRSLKFRHVKGHSGNVWNELCDRMANRARREGEKALRSM